MIDKAAMDKVVTAICNTKKMLPDYWKKTLEQRLCSNGAGSVTNEENAASLEVALLEAVWEPYTHPAIAKGCTAFKTFDVKGLYGMLPIEEVKADFGNGYRLKVINPKGLEYSEVAKPGARKAVNYTVIILGEENGKEVVFTFHPGAPIAPDNALPNIHFKDGDAITVEEAMAYGCKWVKVI